MALPTNVGSGTVTGRLIDGAGAAIEGNVTFTPSPAYLVNTTAVPSPVTIIPKPVTVQLADGAFTTTLTATDDPDNNPSGWTYRVDFALTGAKRASFSIEVPEGGTVDLSTVAPVATAGGVTITQGPAGEAGPAGPGVATGGAAGQLLAKASAADYDTTWVDQSAGGGASTLDGLSDVTTAGVTDGQVLTYDTGTSSWGPATVASGGGAVDSVNGQTGAVVLDAADVGARSDTYVPAWTEVTAKPATFPPDTHTHDDRYYTEAEVDTALAGKQAAGDYATTTELTSGLAGKAATVHSHAVADVTGLQTALDGKQAAGSYAATTHTHTAAQISDSTTTGRSVLTAASQAAARTAIGAGTSSLAIGTTGSTAKAGNYTPAIADLPAGSTLSVVYNGTAWPARPTARTDVIVHWLDFTGTAAVPAGGVENLDLVFQNQGV